MGTSQVLRWATVRPSESGDSSQEQRCLSGQWYTSAASPTVVGRQRAQRGNRLDQRDAARFNRDAGVTGVLLFDGAVSPVHGGTGGRGWRTRVCWAATQGWWSAAGQGGQPAPAVLADALASGRSQWLIPGPRGLGRLRTWRYVGRRAIGNGSAGGTGGAVRPCRMTQSCQRTGEQSSRAVPVNPHCPRSLHRADHAGVPVHWTGPDGRCRAGAMPLSA